MSRPLRLMVYDQTCRGSAMLPGLSHSWLAGSWLYRALDRFDATMGVSSWREALTWLADVQSARPIAEVQYWGHGKWGRALIGGDVLDERSLHASHDHAPMIAAIRDRMRDAGALWWFRTCETFGADDGLRFAQAWSASLGCRAAGHTYIIGAWQSGLHRVEPGAAPHWSAAEGLCEGSPADPRRALWSGPRQPNTISFLHGRVPSGF